MSELEDAVDRVLNKKFGNYLKDIEYRLKSLRGNVVPASKLNLKHHLLDGYVITNNDPQIGYISWADLHIVYEGTTYDIDDGNTNLRYIWWDLSSPTVLQCTNTIPTPYSAVIFEDCEDAWDELVDPDVISEIDTDDKKSGAASLELTVGADVSAGDILATEAKALFDITDYDKVFLWIKTSVAVDEGDLQLLLDDTAECESPIKSLDIPALEADTWAKVGIDLGDASGLSAVVSVGLKMAVDKGAFTIHLDEVYAFGPGTLTEDDAVLFINMDGICFTLPNTYVIDGSLIIPESIYTNALRAHCVTSEKILANSILAMHIGVDELSAITANLGTVTAGLIKSFDGKMQIDLNNSLVTVKDVKDYIRYKAGLLNGDYGMEVRDSQNDLMMSSGETLALSTKYVDKLREYLIGGGYITPVVKGASSEESEENIFGDYSYDIDIGHSNYRVAQKITLSGYQLEKVAFYLRKYNLPTGTAYARVRKVSDDSIIETSGDTLDVSTLTTSYEWKEFTFSCSPNEAVYISIEYESSEPEVRWIWAGAAVPNISGILSYFDIGPPTIWIDGSNYDVTIRIFFLNGKKENTVDGSVSTLWQPKPVNEAGAWISWDLGTSKSITGCQIYWGADANYRPTDYKIYTSPDNSDWTERAHQEGDPGASAWKEHAWTKVTAQYVKFVVTTHGATGTRLNEVQINVVSQSIPSGTKMLFYQASAPTGWTQDTSQNDKVIRVVSGEGGGSGGSWTISGVTVDAHTLITAEIPSHTHGYRYFTSSPYTTSGGTYIASNYSTQQTGATGGGGGHNHGLSADGNWRPAYIDVIIATKD